MFCVFCYGSLWFDLLKDNNSLSWSFSKNLNNQGEVIDVGQNTFFLFFFIFNFFLAIISYNVNVRFKFCYLHIRGFFVGTIIFFDIWYVKLSIELMTRLQWNNKTCQISTDHTTVISIKSFTYLVRIHWGSEIKDSSVSLMSESLSGQVMSAIFR